MLYCCTIKHVIKQRYFCFLKPDDKFPHLCKTLGTRIAAIVPQPIHTYIYTSGNRFKRRMILQMG